MSWHHISTRRSARVMSPEQCVELLRQGEWGVLGLAAPSALCGEHDDMPEGILPYAVPLNYALREGDGLALIFHGALHGLKMDILTAYPHACFTVVPTPQTCPEQLTTRYESVMAYGRMRHMEGEERARALLLFGNRFSKNFPQQKEETLRHFDAKTAVFCLDIDGMTGKFNRGKV